MMPLFWVVLWSTLPTLALSSGQDHCSFHESSSSQSESPLLESLRCHNDYESYVHCTWRKHKDFMWLWFKTENNRTLCEPYDPPYQDEHGTVQCRYITGAFSIAIGHTVFFLENETVCSSVAPAPLDLSLHLRARPPANLSTRDPGDGGRWVSWSSPYPSTSSLYKNLTYQLSYRPDHQDNWTTEVVTNSSMKLDRQLLRPGHTYEARVRARASVGQWSSWSPVVTWRTEEDTGQFPSLHCVLDGETEVMCSWEVSRELAHFITYQLACRLNQTAPSERCCVSPTVSSGRSSTTLRYSCSLTVEDPARLLLELQPTRRARTFMAYQNIRPNPPQQVKVNEKGNNWMVEWTEPSTASKLKLSYQVCYYKTQDQGCSTLLNISKGSMSLTIQGASLAPSQHHQVKVRSLVVPGHGSRYDGVPSEWAEPVDWTSHAAPWSLSILIYVLISVSVVTVFFTLYCTIPACQRRVVLWVDSVPSPGKSKILCEIKSANSATLQSENTSICKVLHYDTVSTCSSNASLWPIVTSNKKPDAGFWNSDTLPAPAERVTTADTSSISFSGPYIFCQQSERNHKSVDVECEEKEEEISSDDSLATVKFAFNREDYVSLPSRTVVSRSTPDIVSSCAANTNAHSHDGAEQHQRCPDNTPRTDKADVQSGLSEATIGDQPPAYTSGPFTPWPQGGTIQASGYFCLPQPK